MNRAEMGPDLVSGYPVAFAVSRSLVGSKRYAAWPVEIPGCIVEGDSLDEARARLGKVLPVFLEEMARLGVPVPAPTPRATVQDLEFSEEDEPEEAPKWRGISGFYATTTLDLQSC